MTRGRFTRALVLNARSNRNTLNIVATRTTRTVATRTGAGVAALVVSSVLAGCGGSSGSGASGTPETTVPSALASAAPVETSTPAGTKLTQDQAVALSQALVKNFQKGGAEFTATVPFGVATFTIEGQMDWTKHLGAATLTTTYKDGVRATQTEQIYWSDRVVVVPLEGLTEEMTKLGRPEVKYVARPLDSRGSTLDRVLVYIDTLASNRAENPVLLRQKDGVAFLGAEDVAGTATNRFSTGANAQFWLTSKAPGSGVMVRSSAQFKGLPGRFELLLRNHGPKTLTFPAEAEVVSIDQIPDLYNELNERIRKAAQVPGS
jgi:hypothetical protein